jgi:hypothetical protein
MSRSYSQEFRLKLYRSDTKSLGVALGVACVEANLPAKYVAPVLNVSRMTIHSWFRGSAIRHRHHKLVSALISIIREDMSKGVLPAKSVADAKGWLRSVIEES